MENKKVIVRANGAGVFFGTLKSKNGSTVVLTNCRKIWRWNGAASIEQLAVDGTSNPSDCKFTVWVQEIEIENVLQTIPCTEKAIESITAVKEWKA
jgi:hypothetical protein